jgi:type IV secretion system protein VirB10
VPMSSNILPLQHPAIVGDTGQPNYSKPPGQRNQQQGSTDDSDQAALNSPIMVYGARAPAQDPNAADHAGRPPPGSADALEASLKPSTLDGTSVSELPNPRWLIEAGRILACTQQTKINSTLPGAVTAIIPREIRGETGDVVLFDKGARVFGTIRHTLMNGADRAEVLWQSITTPVLYDAGGMPHQYRIAVDSPASSDLGETGLDGDVNRHLLLKVGGILGFSFVQTGSQALIQEATKSNNGTTLNLNNVQTGTDQATSTLLNNWVNIPDVLTRDQGLPCGIQVVRDLDMRRAYQLRQQYRSTP